jgi:hypothetical protein
MHLCPSGGTGGKRAIAKAQSGSIPEVSVDSRDERRLEKTVLEVGAIDELTVTRHLLVDCMDWIFVSFILSCLSKKDNFPRKLLSFFLLWFLFSIFILHFPVWSNWLLPSLSAPASYFSHNR